MLLALVDADYKFVFIDVGCNGRISDGGVYRNSPLSHAIQANHISIPKETAIEPGRELHYVIVADDAFPLSNHIIKPYAMRNLTKEQRVFTYRLSRACRVVENAFGILASRFRIFLTPISLSPENTEKVVLASCALHNYLWTKATNRYMPVGSVDAENQGRGIIPGDWRTDISNSLQPIGFQGGKNYSTDAKKVRDSFCEYFNGIGKVPWQDSFI